MLKTLERFYSVPNKAHKIANGVLFNVLTLFNNKKNESKVCESLPYRIAQSMYNVHGQRGQSTLQRRREKLVLLMEYCG